MNFILVDTPQRGKLLPFTHTRPIADIRCGIFTMRERWEHYLKAKTGSICAPHLAPVFPSLWTKDSVLINGSVFGNLELGTAIRQLKAGQKLMQGNTFIAAHMGDSEPINYNQIEAHTAEFSVLQYEHPIEALKHIWDIFSFNEKAIQQDFTSITAGRTSAPLPDYVTALGKEQIFVEQGANIAPCIINATKGPVYIAANAEIMEGCMLRGPIALGPNSVLKMGAKIYGGTTIGEGCKVGGEVSNSVLFANSNKGHDGFLGNAVIGEWCNLGADTNCSNLKNNYDTVKVWDEEANALVSTGLQFCGLMMGDHSKTGINTMLNTGTVVGVSCNIFGSRFPDKFVPSFTWGAAEDSSTYAFDKAMETAARMMERRGKSLSEEQIALYRYIYEQRQ